MTLDFIQAIKETENAAEAVLKKSVEEERRILSQAREEARELMYSEVQEAERQAEDLVKQAGVSAADSIEKLRIQVNEECLLMVKDAVKRSGEVAGEILERIINAYAGS